MHDIGFLRVYGKIDFNETILKRIGVKVIRYQDLDGADFLGIWFTGDVTK